MPPVFRQDSPPPRELFDEWAKNIGLQSASDSSQFTKDRIQLDAMEDLLVRLLPFYLPCRAKEFLYTPLTQDKILTIGRQLARCHGATISSQEKTILGKKSLYYTILPQRTESIPEGGVILEFS